MNLGFVRPDDSDILGNESCRFEIHTSLLPWGKAYQACKHRGLTLASFGDHGVFSSMKSFIESANEVYTSEFTWLTAR
uniref:C-type lectin domain-containing protein n=1 Tax=Magallana gigas TaxID=29159 RepID=K1RN34_MAGGI